MPPAIACVYMKRIAESRIAFLYCPKCSLWRSRPPPHHRSLLLNQKRVASTLISTTAVNATKIIPERNKHLHQALNELAKKASAYVSLGRLRLALQGLESAHPTIRIAFLGVDVTATARRLTRLLLADASRPQQEWETQLVRDETEQRLGLVLRFGNPPNEALQAPPRSGLPVILVPAPVLREQGLEILISCVNAPDPSMMSDTTIPSDVLFSPTVSTPASADARPSLVSLPVHRTIIVSGGVDELLSVAQLLAWTKFESPIERSLVNVVLCLDGEAEISASRTMRVDMAKAEGGLQAAQEALDRGLDFEKAWAESGMPTLSKWLGSLSARGSQGLSPILYDLIASLLEAAAANIASHAKEAETIARSRAVTARTRLVLEDAINAFSKQGHAELQSGLAAAWASRNWRKLAFWKLFWRVDDVPLIVTDLLTSAWLPHTERAVYELTGRMKQAGISLPPPSAAVSFSEPQTSATSEHAIAKEVAYDGTGQPLILASTASAEGVSTPLLPPARTPIRIDPRAEPTPSLATMISTSRQRFITGAITSLTSSAQQIVLKALTLAGASAGLSALSFLSITTGSVYESATIVALGTAYALRRMQRAWEAQCRDLESGLMEEGRTVLKQTEEYLRRRVEEASHVVEDEAEVRLRKEANEAVERAKVALSEHNVTTTE